MEITTFNIGYTYDNVVVVDITIYVLVLYLLFFFLQMKYIP